MDRVRNGVLGFEDENERDEIIRLTQMAKAWEFTCSFCFKKFPSAQAMGGHQNAHRNERLMEKRLFVKDPISFRKRNYVKAIKKAAAVDAGGGLGGVNVIDRGINGGARPSEVAGLVMRDFMGVEEQVATAAAIGMNVCSKGAITAQCDDDMNVDLTLKL